MCYCFFFFPVTPVEWVASYDNGTAAGATTTVVCVAAVGTFNKQSGGATPKARKLAARAASTRRGARSVRGGSSNGDAEEGGGGGGGGETAARQKAAVASEPDFKHSSRNVIRLLLASALLLDTLVQARVGIPMTTTTPTCLLFFSVLRAARHVRPGTRRYTTPKIELTN